MNNVLFFCLFVWLWSQSADKLTIHSIPCSWFYKPTFPQSSPSHLQDYSICNNARLEFSTIFVPSFDPNEWCLKNGLHSGGLNPGPLGHESSALTTRPRLLASGWIMFDYIDPKPLGWTFLIVSVDWILLAIDMKVWGA